MKKFLLICSLLCLGLFVACPKEMPEPIEEPKVELRQVPAEYQDTVRVKNKLFVHYQTVRGDNLWNISKDYLCWVNDAKPNNSQIFYYWLRLLPKDLNKYTDFLSINKVIYLPYLEPKQPEISQPTVIEQQQEIHRPAKREKGQIVFYHYPLWFQIALVVFLIGSIIIVVWIVIQDLR